MTTTEPETESTQKRSVYDRLRLIDMRRGPEGWIGGVCAGLAHRVGLDPLVIRAGFIVLGLFFGLGVLLYLVAWVLIPDQHEATHFESGLRLRSVGSGVLLLVAAAALLIAISGEGGPGTSFGSVVIGLIVLGGLGYGMLQVWNARPSPGAVTLAGTQSRYAGPPPFASGAAPAADSSLPAYVPSGPRRGRRLSGGGALALLATGGVLITVGAFTAMGEAWSWGGNPIAVGWALALGALGLLLVTLGFTGRRAGFVGFLALLTAIAVGATATWPANLQWDSSTGQLHSVPTTGGEIEDLAWGFGEIDVDLSELDPTALEGQRLNIDLTAGQVDITVPSDMTIAVTSQVGAGEFVFSDLATNAAPQRSAPAARIESEGQADQVVFDTGYFSTDGVGKQTRALVGQGSIDLYIDVEVGFGQVRVTTEDKD